MAKNLTSSYGDRQSILNNFYLVQKIEQRLNLSDFFEGILIYNDCFVFTKWQLERLFDISTIIISKYAKTYQHEFETSGYVILQGEAIQDFLASSDLRTIETNIKYDINILRIKGLELFTFKALLNMAMLLSPSETAKFIRHIILDTAIGIIAEREGCHTNCVDRRIEYFCPLVRSNYYWCADAFMKTIEQYVESSVSVVRSFTGKDFRSSEALLYERVYELIFGDEHKQDRQYLGHYTSSYECSKDNYKSEARFRSHSSIENRFRIVLCHEIKQAIINIENLLAQEIEFASKQQNRKIKFKELDEIVDSIENSSHFQPFIKEARVKMATVKLLDSSPESLDDILSERREDRLKTIAKTDLNSFIAAKSQSLKDKLMLSETLAVFQRLKDR